MVYMLTKCIGPGVQYLLVNGMGLYLSPLAHGIRGTCYGRDPVDIYVLAFRGVRKR